IALTISHYQTGTSDCADKGSGASILSDVTRGRLGHRYRIGVWDVDPRGCTLSCAGAVTKLAPRAMDVLVYLASRPGETVSHAEVLWAVLRGAQPFIKPV